MPDLVETMYRVYVRNVFLHYFSCTSKPIYELVVSNR
jgi:hypothetical protein